MQRCPSCDHFSAADATECERCGQSLPSESEEGASASSSDATTPDSFEARVLEAARKSGKITAIKLYREQRGGNLKEAKEAVEALMAEHGVTSSTGSGCGATVLAVVVLLIAVIRLAA
jgi:hypothetical protein